MLFILGYSTSQLVYYSVFTNLRLIRCFNFLEGYPVAAVDGLMSIPQQDGLETEELPVETIPNEADFLIGYATVPGYVSFRSKSQGSWYINTLVRMLHKYGDR